MDSADQLNKVDHFETLWVPLSDGTRLAARMWRPKDAEINPVPVILEYIPYRRRDATRLGDDLTHPYFAAHGYACVRLDIRGTGDSDGVILDEYLKQEQDDAVEAIAWLASQKWCNGNVGMMGISWGGFNSLQVAARRPPALKAIVTVCSTDDRYADDMHYMGGAPITGTLDWGASFFVRMGLAPDPLVVGERWREMWLERLDNLAPAYGTWLRHQRRDEYWRHGSVADDIDSISCAVMAVGGWADGYTNAIFRLLKNLSAPKMGIVGPWGHKYPHYGVPGPAIGFLTEALRWWDYWLKGIDTGIMAEPVLRAYIQDSIEPRSHYDHRPGKWVAEPAWPSNANVALTFHLNSDGLGQGAGAEVPLTICSPQTTGSTSGEWCAYSTGGLSPELPTDQRHDDSFSLVFDSPPLDAPLEILGAPELAVELQSDERVAQIIVRLNDIAPDGSVTRVTYGVLNLTHRDSHADPQPLEPGKRYRVRVQLNDVGHRFLQGNRIRVAISTVYWPIVWPAPRPVTLTVMAGLSTLTLPQRPSRTEDAQVRFAPPENTKAGPKRVIKPGSAKHTHSRDIGAGPEEIELLRDDGKWVIEDTGVEASYSKRLVYSIHPDDPTKARAEAQFVLTYRHKDGWDTRVQTHSAVACTETHFIIEADVEACEGGTRVFSRSFTERVARDLS